jgi:phage terminase small subunit
MTETAPQGGAIPKPKKSAYKSLTPKQRDFVDAYIANGFNATKAAITAKYSAKTARSIGSENLTKPDIQAAIKEQVALTVMGPSEVVVRWAQIARLNLGDYVVDVPVWTKTQGDPAPKPKPEVESEESGAVEDADPESPPLPEPLRPIATLPMIDHRRLIEDGNGYALKGIKYNKFGVELVFHDSTAALDRLAKNLGLLIDQHQHSGVGGKPIEIALADPKAKLRERLAKLKAQPGAGE